MCVEEIKIIDLLLYTYRFQICAVLQIMSPHNRGRKSSAILFNKHLPSTYHMPRSMGCPGKSRWMKDELCCQSFHWLLTKTAIESGWGSLMVGGTKSHKNTEKRVFNINSWVAGCWGYLKGSSRLWVLKFAEDFVGGNRSREASKQRDRHMQRYKGVWWLNMDDSVQGRTRVRLWQKAMCSYKFLIWGKRGLVGLS